MNKKALLIRIDRIGDLVLTLPSDQQASLANYEKHWFIHTNLGFVAKNSLPSREFTEWDKSFSWKQFIQFYKKIRALKPDLSISFHSPWWVNLALCLAGVPERVGVLSQWHSYLFLNKGLRQKRSQCEYHELEYNHRLIHDRLAPQSPLLTPALTLTAPTTNLPPLADKYVVIHPGMAGSALNWPIHYYAELIEKWSGKIQVVITGTKSDQFILQPLQKILDQKDNIVWLNEQLVSEQLLGVLQNAKFVFAPSTGVIHLAASLGVPTFGIYSPVRVQRAERWGPRGTNTKTWTPSVNCPGDFKCLGESCAQFNCMELVRPEEIYKYIQSQLKT